MDSFRNLLEEVSVDELIGESNVQDEPCCPEDVYDPDKPCCPEGPQTKYQSKADEPNNYDRVCVVSNGKFFYWKNGRGQMVILKHRKNVKNTFPAMKGQIILDNRCYILSGWINSGGKSKSKYISILVSERNSEGVYKKSGIGYLRYSKQIAPKQPSMRGEIKIDKECYSLSAWKTNRKGNEILYLNSRPFTTTSYSEVQNDLERWISASLN